jgi:hypothetical protein
MSWLEVISRVKDVKTFRDVQRLLQPSYSKNARFSLKENSGGRDFQDDGE